MSGEAEWIAQGKVVDVLRQWLPDLTTPGMAIVVEAVDPEQERDGARFVVYKAVTPPTSRR